MRQDLDPARGAAAAVLLLLGFPERSSSNFNRQFGRPPGLDVLVLAPR